MPSGWLLFMTLSMTRRSVLSFSQCLSRVGVLGVTHVCSLQGEMLDNIELNVMHTVDHVEKARDETKRAVKYKGQARKVRLLAALRGVPTLPSLAFSLACLCRLRLFHVGKGSHD